jgi:hypothetical protein
MQFGDGYYSNQIDNRKKRERLKDDSNQVRVHSGGHFIPCGTDNIGMLH